MTQYPRSDTQSSQATAYNGRFGKSGGGARRKSSTENHLLYFRRNLSEPPAYAKPLGR